MKIRRATTKDVHAMYSILESADHQYFDGAAEYYYREEYTDPNYKSYKGPYYSPDYYKKANLKSLRERLAKPYTTYVLLEENVIVGYIIIEKHLGRLWVNDLLVHQDYQHKGYGKQLFAHVAKQGQETYLWVNDKNPAKQFWKELGFKEVLSECLMKK